MKTTLNSWALALVLSSLLPLSSPVRAQQADFTINTTVNVDRLLEGVNRLDVLCSVCSRLPCPVSGTSTNRVASGSTRINTNGASQINQAVSVAMSVADGSTDVRPADAEVFVCKLIIDNSANPVSADGTARVLELTGNINP